MLQFLRPRLCAVTAATRQLPSRHSIPRTPSRRAYTAPARLSGRTCMITGGTSGIGYAIAERFLQEGAGRIILVGRSYERLVNAAKGLGASGDIEDGPTKAEEGEKKRIRLLVSDISNPDEGAQISEKDMVSEPHPRSRNQDLNRTRQKWTS